MRALVPAFLFLIIGTFAALPFRRPADLLEAPAVDPAPTSSLDETQVVALDQLPPSAVMSLEEMSTPPIEAAPAPPVAQSYQEVMVPLLQTVRGPSTIQTPSTRGEWERGQVLAQDSGRITQATEQPWRAVLEPVSSPSSSESPSLATARTAASLGFPNKTSHSVEQSPVVIDQLPPPTNPPPRRYFIYEPK